jgi:hypothetical protein
MGVDLADRGAVACMVNGVDHDFVSAPHRILGRVAHDLAIMLGTAGKRRARQDQLPSGSAVGGRAGIAGDQAGREPSPSSSACFSAWKTSASAPRRQ